MARLLSPSAARHRATLSSCSDNSTTTAADWRRRRLTRVSTCGPLILPTRTAGYSSERNAYFVDLQATIIPSMLSSLAHVRPMI